MRFANVLFLSAMLAVTGCSASKPSQSAAPAATPSTATTAATSKPADAKPNRDPARFAAEIEAFEKYDRKNTPPQDAILFVGSSSIVRWQSARDYPQYTILNRGFGGSTPADVNHYFDRIVAPYHPRLIVLFTSDNGIVLGDSAEQTLAAFREFVVRARKLSPATPLIYISIKPSPSRMEFWTTAAEANRLIAAECRKLGPLVRYVDIVPAMMKPDGSPREDLFVADMLHMNDAGYAVWNKALAPVLAECLAQK